MKISQLQEYLSRYQSDLDIFIEWEKNNLCVTKNNVLVEKISMEDPSIWIESAPLTQSNFKGPKPENYTAYQRVEPFEKTISLNETYKKWDLTQLKGIKQIHPLDLAFSTLHFPEGTRENKNFLTSAYGQGEKAVHDLQNAYVNGAARVKNIKLHVHPDSALLPIQVKYYNNRGNYLNNCPENSVDTVTFWTARNTKVPESYYPRFLYWWTDESLNEN